MLCPACHQDLNQEILHLEGLPVLCNELWPDEASARSCPRGEMRLHVCSFCGLIFNAAFDPSLLAYAEEYETSLHFSATFQSYAEDLARSLVLTHSLKGRTAIEIGCGRGDFLVLLHNAGMGTCLGFDRSYSPGLHLLPEEVEIQPRYYSEVSPRPKADLVCSRHVLEHIPEPSAHLEELRQALETDGLLYLEVPNARFTLEEGGVWDLIYEHCNYFTKSSLTWLLVALGFGEPEVRSDYGGQFLCSRSRLGEPTSPPGPVRDAEEVLGAAERLADARDRRIQALEVKLVDGLRAGRSIAIWGAGSKGVTFLNSLPSGGQIALAIDKNPRKQGRYLPGTGQKVLSPEEAAGSPLDLVFVMNPIYTKEIEAQLRDLGCKPELILVS